MIIQDLWIRKQSGCIILTICFLFSSAVKEVPVPFYGDKVLLPHADDWDDRLTLLNPMVKYDHQITNLYKPSNLYWQGSHAHSKSYGAPKPQKGRNLQLQKRRPRWKKKIFIYDDDDRVLIDSSLLTMFPYVNIVRLSLGCMGTLLSPSFVLTAAHCVHNGTHFGKNLEMLKVYVTTFWGTRMYNIIKISLPTAWLMTVTPTNLLRIQYDYAVLQLSIAVHDRKMFAPLHVPDYSLLRRNIYFYAFNTSTNFLWKSVCSEVSHLKISIWVSQCDSSTGNSGATVFDEDRLTREKRIIGLVSSTTWISTIHGTFMYTVIPVWTDEKVRDVCHILGREGEEYNVCQGLTNNGHDNPSIVHVVFW